MIMNHLVEDQLPCSYNSAQGKKIKLKESY